MEKFKQLLRYINYLIKSKDEHGIHSPFVFDLLTDVIQDTTPFYIYEDIEAVRKEMLQSEKEIRVTDYGAGSKICKDEKRKIGKIAESAAITPKYGRLLFRLVFHFKPQTILEIGTSIGIGTMYLAGPNKKAKVFTLEGCPEQAAVAKSNFKKLSLPNIEIITGNFDQTLPGFLSAVEQLDLIFLDGNHSKYPTLSYFNKCLQKSHENTLIILDDIHWSGEMEEAWEEIKQNERVSLTLDLFRMGLVFFKKGIPKQDFVIRF